MFKAIRLTNSRFIQITKQKPLTERRIKDFSKREKNEHEKEG